MKEQKRKTGEALYEHLRANGLPSMADAMLKEYKNGWKDGFQYFMNEICKEKIRVKIKKGEIV